MANDFSGIHLGHLKDEIQGIIMEKRGLLEHHKTKKRPQEMVANTEYHLNMLTEVWRTLDRIDKGQPSPYPPSPKEPVKEKSITKDVDTAEDLDDDLSDGW